MKFVKGLLILLVLVAAVVLGGGLLLNDEVHVQRSISIERPPAEVYAVVSSMARFNEWSPWRDYDPTAKQEVSGPATGVGGKLTWSGEKGAGSMEIVKVVENAQVTTQLDFGPDGKATSDWLLSAEGDGTRITWSFDSKFEGNLLGRWFGLMMDSMIGPEYERGLKDLKTLVESTPAAVPQPPATVSGPADDLGSTPDQAEAAEQPEAGEGESQGEGGDSDA
ncbi:SRPBCC family protein [Pseudomarimonas arenosa]|uniref:SRPBCC family protein n=1 Tax=Pseudomarimonas arenosa TaxID=2774145 RepID=A0AAW3ZLL7_9GAMM|nr:SRPBCC family protein [Pseudomarimonas arenosa]MBD8526858.1 SRPBCC family protein [Pseudomarimonas arenosa]